MQTEPISTSSEENKSEEFSDLRWILKHEFEERCKKNTRYSLRAYAKSLGIQVSPLSAILRNKRTLTPSMVKRLGEKLELSDEQLSACLRTAGQSVFEQLDMDQAALIADWYHYAILDLVKLSTFEPNIAFVAHALQISESEVKEALERLIRLNLIKIEKDKWSPASPKVNVSNLSLEKTTEAKKDLQKQLLEKAMDAVDATPFELRSNNSMSMAINPEDLEWARKEIIEFTRQLTTKLEKTTKPTQVYNFTAAFFPLTHIEEKK